MSMLADPKSKPSWVLNPRASEWSKDQNKLGQKMLEKMGWSVGKGLGAREQGHPEALRIAYKADCRGLGAKRKQEQEFALQQQENFQKFLQELNGSDDRKVAVKSLEEKSKTSRARMHYHKFTRGKDISRYSQKDLSCIVGSGFIPIHSTDASDESVVSEEVTIETRKISCDSEEAEMNLRSGRNLDSEEVKDIALSTGKVKRKSKRNLDEQVDSPFLSVENVDAALGKKKLRRSNSAQVDPASETLEEDNNKLKKRNKKNRSDKLSSTHESEVVTEETNFKSSAAKPESKVERTRNKKKKSKVESE